MWNRPGKFKIFRILCQDEVIEKQGVPRVTICNNEHIVFTKRSIALSKRVHFIGKNTRVGNAAVTHYSTWGGEDPSQYTAVE